MGTEGVGKPQFVWEIYSIPRPPLEVPKVEDGDLKWFVKDLPFNFSIEQALESLGDSGVLAEVARLCTLIVHVPIYAKLAQSVQELLEAVHKFQKGFNEKTSQVIIHLKATKKWMEAARVKSCTHVALLELIRTWHL